MSSVSEKKLTFSFNVSLSSIVLVGIIVQIFSTQGILMYNLFKVLGNWELKKYLHPIGVMIVLIPSIYSFFSKKRIVFSAETILLFGYLTLHYLILIFFKNISVDSFLYSFREVALIFTLIASYRMFYFPKKYLNVISKTLIILSILNIIFVLLTMYIGPEAYMKLLTGRYFWPTDPLLKFKISTFVGGFYRSPGLIGESASVGFFGVFSFFLILHSQYKRYFWIPLILVLLSFTRSAYLVLIIYGLLLILKKKKYLRIAIRISPLIIGALFYAIYINLFDIRSLWMRIDNWINKIDLNSNVLFGGNLNRIGSTAADGSGFESVFDNYWLFLYHGIGLFGIFLVLIFLSKKKFFTNSTFYISISLFISGLFITYTQSIPFLVFFPLLTISNWWYEEKN